MPLGNHLVADLLQTARFLLDGAAGVRGNLGKAYRRRAISTAYYATFHAVAFIFTDALVRWARPGALVEPVFRSLDHKVARDRLVGSSHPDLNEIGLLFTALQSKRNDADYKPPAHNPSAREAAQVVTDAQAAIAKIEALSSEVRLAFAVSIISKYR